MGSYKYMIGVLLLSFAHKVTAQLSFPNDSTLNLKTTQSVLYIETGIYFHTGQYKITDYRWSRSIIDSLDPRWDFQACMNGDCKIGLPANGPFIADFGRNDTTGFIRFHVNTGEYSGQSTLRYYIRNTKDATDGALLTFNITYLNTTGMFETTRPNRQLLVYPNPTQSILNIVLPRHTTTEKIEVYTMLNQCIHTQAIDGSTSTTIDTSQLPEGMYRIVIGNSTGLFSVIHH